MTSGQAVIKRKSKSRYWQSCICLALSILMVAFGEEMKDSIRSSIVYCGTTILPTLFPFFVISDLWSAYYYVDPNGRISKCFERLFGISGYALSAVMCGLICGFPVGVKFSVELYNRGVISRDELERLCGLVNNPSLAFVISGIGSGILGSIRSGILLYISVALSTACVALLFRKKNKRSKNTGYNIGQSFVLAESIGYAGISSAKICSFIIFFSGIIGLMSSFINHAPALALISAFLEVSNAVKMIGALPLFTYQAKLIFIAFALGFSGLSVHLQAFSFLPPEVSRGKYLFMKIIQGCVSAVIMLIHLISIK